MWPFGTWKPKPSAISVMPIIRRKPSASITRVEYSATPLGVSLDDVLAPFAEWSKQHADRIGAQQAAE